MHGVRAAEVVYHPRCRTRQRGRTCRAAAAVAGRRGWPEADRPGMLPAMRAAEVIAEFAAAFNTVDDAKRLALLAGCCRPDVVF
jgi:hypothetical protein